MSETFVVDANVFIKNLNLLVNLSRNSKIITTQSVILELKDKRTLENVKTYLPYIKTFQPTNQSIEYVTRVSQNTGDYSSLSEQDIELIALAIDFLIQENQFKYKDLDKPTEEKKESQQLKGWGYFDEKNSEGWIGQEDISQQTTLQAEKTVKLLSGDFAVQNVALVMGIPLMSIDGDKIKQVKQYVLECSACEEITKDLTLVFCPSCSKNSLLKVSCGYDEDGELILYRKKNYQHRIRGVRYNIPEPKGGRRIQDLILTEQDYEQPKVQRYIQRAQAKEKKQQGKAIQDFDNFRGLEEKSSNSKYKILKVGYGGKNPNVSKKRK